MLRTLPLLHALVVTAGVLVWTNPLRNRPMARAKKTASLQIDDDLKHHRAAWRAERIGWVVMAMLLLAALVGLLGDGPLSRANVADASGFRIEYDRLLRASAPSEFRIEAPPSIARDGELRVRFDQSLLDHVEIESILPEPKSVSAGPGHTEFVFDIASATSRPSDSRPSDGRPGEGAAHVTLHFRPKTFGYYHGRVSAPGVRPATIAHFVYP